MLAVNKPAEVTVPVPVDEMFPEVVTASPAVFGESVVPVLFQKPMIPVEGGVDVKFLDPSVYKPDDAVSPDRFNPVKIGEAPVLIFWVVFTAPLETEKLVELKEATPFVVVVASIPATVSVPPSDTGEPETEIPVPAVGVTVIEELAN